MGYHFFTFLCNLLIAKRVTRKKNNFLTLLIRAHTLGQCVTIASFLSFLSYKCDEWHDSRKDMKDGEKSKTQ